VVLALQLVRAVGRGLGAEYHGRAQQVPLLANVGLVGFAAVGAGGGDQAVELLQRTDGLFGQVGDLAGGGVGDVDQFA
jgi:hypothetical protein